IAHNAHVDVDVLLRALGDWECPEVFDTLKVSRRLLPNRVSYRLSALIDAFHLADGLPDGRRPHRAAYDAQMTARLFVHLASSLDASQSLEDLRGQPAEGGSDGAITLF